MQLNTTILVLSILNGLKEGYFLILAPFLPDQMDRKDIPKLVYTPIFVYVILIDNAI